MAALRAAQHAITNYANGVCTVRLRGANSYLRTMQRGVCLVKPCNRAELGKPKSGSAARYGVTSELCNRAELGKCSEPCNHALPPKGERGTAATGNASGMMNRCPQCGAIVSERAAWCRRCGYPILPEAGRP